MSERERAYYIATHPYLFRTGEPALIVGVEMVNNRPCFRVQYADGFEDTTLIVNEDFVGKGGAGVFYEIKSLSALTPCDAPNPWEDR